MALKEISTVSIMNLQVLDEQGQLDVNVAPSLTKDQLIRLYRAMVLVREADSRMLKLQRTGRIGTFPPTTGQEAVACGAAMAMGDRDWLVGSYRELGARLMRGDTLVNALLYYNGFEEGNVVPADKRIIPTQVILGSQVPHAVGIGYAMKQRGEKDSAVVTFFGDGASSEGDVHEAMNFAAVWKAPVVFVLVNNGWAISTPLCKQTAADNFAIRGAAYGIPAIQVDGNDALAVYKAVSDALDRAKKGDGPSFIEAVTYRLLMHTTADDPTKYRSEADVEVWWKKEPLIRFRRFLEQTHQWTTEQQEQLEKEIRAEIDGAVVDFERSTNRKPDSSFDHVLGSGHPEIERQRSQFLSRQAITR